MKDDGSLEVGDVVIYHDEYGKPHNALMTAVWGAKVSDGPAGNLLFLSSNEAEQDNYGRQVKRESSVCHVSRSMVHGRYWRLSTEEARPYVPPVSA